MAKLSENESIFKEYIRKLILVLLLLISLSFAEETCEKYSDYIEYCYNLRNEGKVKSLKQAYKMLSKFKAENDNLLKKACKYGFTAESLYEINEIKKIFIEECNSQSQK